MTAFIEITNNEARFAFNKNNGDPWHRMGTPVDGHGTVQEMLAAAKADFAVKATPLYIKAAESNDLVEVADKVATVREEVILSEDGVTTETTALGVVGKNYNIEQNQSAAEWALELVGASQGDAVIDTMGVLRDGKEFFVGVDLGTLVLDPDGVADTIKKYLVVRNSHDGTMSLAAYPTNTRVVCWNTATWSYEEAKITKQVHRVRHTSGKDERKAEAVVAMGLANRLAKLFADQALTMMRLPSSPHLVRSLVDSLWPLSHAETDKQKTLWNDRLDTIQRIYNGPTCVENFGHSGWTAWNAITEYLDHHRPRTTQKSRALASMDVDNTVAKVKDLAAQLILSNA